MLSFFVSQNEHEYHPEFGCGVASLMMLLRFNDFSPMPSWKELADLLNITKPPQEKFYTTNDSTIGVYLEDLLKFVMKQQLPFRVHFFDNEWEQSLQIAPIMVLVVGGDEFTVPHWIVLTKKQDYTIMYLDPWYKTNEQYERNLLFSDFKKYYTGIALQIFMPNTK